MENFVFTFTQTKKINSFNIQFFTDENLFNEENQYVTLQWEIFYFF